MPIFKDFSENGKLLDSRHEILNVSNIERYIKEHGIERAKGYIDALIDISSPVNDCANEKQTQPGGDITEVPRSEEDMRERIQELYFSFGDTITLVESAVEKIVSRTRMEPK